MCFKGSCLCNLLYCACGCVSGCVCGGACDILASAQIMEKAAKVPASPCPLMMGVVYEAGRIPASPNRLLWKIAPNAGKGQKTRSFSFMYSVHFFSGRTQKLRWGQKATDIYDILWKLCTSKASEPEVRQTGQVWTTLQKLCTFGGMWWGGYQSFEVLKTRWAVPHVSVGVGAGSFNPAALHNKQTQWLQAVC